MGFLGSAARASRQVRTWAMRSGEEFVRNLVQPVRYFVPRPPASRGRLCFTFAVWLFAACMALFAGGGLAFRSAHNKYSVTRASGLDTADKVNFGYSETTQYPVTVRIPLDHGNLIEVILLGPKYQDAQALQKLFKSMHCALEVDHGDLFYKVYGNGLVRTNPSDYRRTCNPLHDKSVQVKLNFDGSPTRFFSLFYAIASVRQLEHYPFSANVSDFVVLQLCVTRLKTKWFGLEDDKADLQLDLALEDGRRYILTFSMLCNIAVPLTQQIRRSCTYAVPYLKRRNGQLVTSDNFPDDCPLDMNDPAIVHFNQTLHRALSHSIMTSAVKGWNRTRRQGDAVPELRSALNPFCQSEWRQFGHLLADNSKTDLSIDQMIELVARNVSEARVYEVRYDGSEFAGVVTLLALAWPLFTLWISFSHLVIPIIYKHSTKIIGTDHLEAKQPTREPTLRQVGYVDESKNDLPISSCASWRAQEDDAGKELHVDRNMFEDVDRDSDRCTDEHSAKPFAGDGAATSDCDAVRELVFQELIDFLHCLVDAAVSKHVERIGSEMSRAIAESRMPARHVHFDGCFSHTPEEGDATQCGGAQSGATANGCPRVVDNSMSTVEDLQERLVAIAALSSQFTSETSLLCSPTQVDAIEKRSRGSDVGEWTCGGASNRYSLLQGSASDPMPMSEASTRFAFMQLMSRLEQRFAALARTTAVDTVSMHLDQFVKDCQSRADATRSSLEQRIAVVGRATAAGTVSMHLNPRTSL